MLLKADSEMPIEERWAKELYEKKILPDVNAVFVKKILKVVNEKMPNPIIEASFKANTKGTWEHDKKILCTARDQLAKIKDCFRPLVHWMSDDPPNLKDGQLTNVGLFIRQAKRDELIGELSVHLEKALGIADELIKHTASEYKRLFGNLPGQSRTMLARSIWAIKKLVENEIERRRRLSLPLYDLKRGRGKEYPSYASEWKLVAALVKVFYWKKWESSIEMITTHSNVYYAKILASQKEEVSKYFTAVSIRRFAYRYGSKYLRPRKLR